MYNRKAIKVLVVDDSILFRAVLVQGLSADPFIQVVGTAADPYGARDMIIELEPDVLTLDVEMPRMSGIEFLRRLMPQHPLPVVVVSSVSDNVFDALKAGAVDFVTKPAPGNRQGIDTLINELIVKVKIASTAKVGQWKTDAPIAPLSGVAGKGIGQVIAIGASTGGTEAIEAIVRQFPRAMPGTVIVQHMPPVFTRMYAERLNNSCLVEVKEARTGDKVHPSRVLIAPGDHHLRLVKRGGELEVECRSGDRVNGHCPSVDVLFNSVADHVRDMAVGVILTGMGYDGAKGLLRMRQAGARTIGQDEESSVVYGMPKIAWDIGAVERQLPLTSIPRAIFSMIGE